MIVIARYNEDLAWLAEIKQPYIIYNKGSRLNIDCIEIENIGREGDTWIRYIIEHYENLPEFIYFLQGNPFEHCSFINVAVNYKCRGFYGIGKILKCDGLGKPHHRHEDLNVSETYKLIFGEEKNRFIFTAGAQYAVNKKCIKNKSLGWWENLYKIYHETELSAWVFERLWFDIWEYKIIKNEGKRIYTSMRIA